MGSFRTQFVGSCLSLFDGLWPTSANSRPKSTNFGRALPNICQFDPKSAKLWPRTPNLGRVWADILLPEPHVGNLWAIVGPAGIAGSERIASNSRVTLFSLPFSSSPGNRMGQSPQPRRRQPSNGPPTRGRRFHGSVRKRPCVTRFWRSRRVVSKKAAAAASYIAAQTLADATI